MILNSPISTSPMPRPSYNTGVGFFVGTDKKLYDANGVEFRIRGINRVHYDSQALQPIIDGSYANTMRMVTYVNSLPNNTPESYNIAIFQKTIDGGIIPMPGIWWSSVGEVTGSHDPATLAAAVDDWIAVKDYYKPIERWTIINIANEWSGGWTEWKTEYKKAISRMRAAGYLNTLVIDAGAATLPGLVDSAFEVFESDPQRNCIFSIHIYGDATLATIDNNLAYLARIGAPCIVGEFGPWPCASNNPGGQTDLTPTALITAAIAHGHGWLAWSWDDMGQPYHMVDDAATVSLNAYGEEVVNKEPTGLKYSAKKATVFP